MLAADLDRSGNKWVQPWAAMNGANRNASRCAVRDYRARQQATDSVSWSQPQWRAIRSLNQETRQKAVGEQGSHGASSAGSYQLKFDGPCC